MTFIFISTFVLLLVLPTNFVCAFVVSVNHVNQGTPSSVSPMQQRFSITTASTTSTTATGSSYLQAVALPAEQEDEKQKKKKNDNEEDEWTATKGGFIPNILKRRKQQQKQKQQKQQTQTHPSIHMVDNIHDYKNVVVDETEQIVVVRFFASWCRSCKATKPLFNKLVRTYASQSQTSSSEYGGGVNGVNVKFVEVPLTKETAYLQEGLGVPSVPFAHIYHPEGGLVEEVKISKPHFKDFHQKLTSYVVGSCDLPMEMDTASASASENESQIEEEGMNMNTNMNMEDGTIGAFE